jgi:hypothetical protein
MSAKFPGDWVRKPRLEHVKLGIRRALDLDPNVPRTTTELWSGLALHREKSLTRSGIATAEPSAVRLSCCAFGLDGRRRGPAARFCGAWPRRGQVLTLAKKGPIVP